MLSGKIGMINYSVDGISKNDQKIIIKILLIFIKAAKHLCFIYPVYLVTVHFFECFQLLTIRRLKLKNWNLQRVSN